MTGSMVVKPAYGRSYRSLEAAKKDWNDGKDFFIYPSGPYFSIRDSKELKRQGVTELLIVNVDLASKTCNNLVINL